VTARDLALAELDRRVLPGWKAHELRRPPLRGKGDESLDPRDLALAEQILVGCVKNHLLLRRLIVHHSGRHLRSIDPLVQKVLSIGLYQLRFLDRIPASAAVNEAVEQAKRFGRARAAGFVNAVLRKAATSGGTPPLLPDPALEPAAYAETALSHPRELFDRLVRLLGVPDALRFCEHDNREPPTIVRLMPDASADDLQSPGVTVTPHAHLGMFVVEPAKKALLAEWARRGIAQVQDPTAATVVEQIPISPGQHVLDRCAGLGTKTIQLREKVGDGGQVVAIDAMPQRVQQLQLLLAERQLGNVEVYQATMLPQLSQFADRLFDVALVDVPCSNSGVLARRAEARYAQTDAALASLSNLQAAILDDTAPHVKAGGLLVYSTCSVWPEENGVAIEAFLARHPDYQRQPEHATLPSLSLDITNYQDGGYLAVLQRRAR
jgi:16S rRNA (cytosine967-C5)-methyltransferase